MIKAISFLLIYKKAKAYYKGDVIWHKQTLKRVVEITSHRIRHRTKH